MEKSVGNLCGRENPCSFGTNWNRQELNYRSYSFKIREYIQYTAIWFGIVLVFSYTFYHRFWAVLPGMLFLPFYLRSSRKKLQQKRQCVLRSQFRDAIQSMDGYLRAGYSVENAMNRSREDILHMWGKDSYMGKELQQMTGQMRMNVPVEEVWEDLAGRSGIFQIEQFACIFRITKRSGGNVSAVIRSSMGQITEQIRTEEEIRTILASRTLQMQIMNFVPIGMLLYVGMASPDLLKVMYETAAGKITMTLCLGVYAAAYYGGKYMMREIL